MVDHCCWRWTDQCPAAIATCTNRDLWFYSNVVDVVWIFKTLIYLLCVVMSGLNSSYLSWLRSDVSCMQTQYSRIVGHSIVCIYIMPLVLGSDFWGDKIICRSYPIYLWAVLFPCKYLHYCNLSINSVSTLYKVIVSELCGYLLAFPTFWKS